MSPVVFPKLLPDGQFSHAPLSEAGTTNDFSPELSLPQSPQLKSTAREQSRYHLPRLWQGRCSIHLLMVLNTNTVMSAAFQSIQITARVLQLRVLPAAWEDQAWRPHRKIIRYYEAAAQTCRRAFFSPVLPTDRRLSLSLFYFWWVFSNLACQLLMWKWSFVFWIYLLIKYLHRSAVWCWPVSMGQRCPNFSSFLKN